ncbi:acyl-CoA dehydrogenase family protein, partial [Zoogloea sp.]|uniref:acyl-CoA dehydrogenase family protein n=1 Tax=Zoogloea sp. TaxID=49181 RepID=UPI0025DC6230
MTDASLAARVDRLESIEAIRQLCIHTLALRDAGLPHTKEAAMCKWMGPKYAVDVIHQCLLTFGHY